MNPRGLGGALGQASVEFAFTFAAFIFITAGIFDFSLAIFYYNSLAEAARAGARYAIVHGENTMIYEADGVTVSAASTHTGPCGTAEYTDSDGQSWCSCDAGDDSASSNPANGSKIREAVVSRATGMNTDASKLKVYCFWPDRNVSGVYLNQRNKRVKVRVEYTYQPTLTAFIPSDAGSITLRGETASFIQY